LVIDDEAPARQLLREFLEEHNRQAEEGEAQGLVRVEVVAECANGFAAVKEIAEREPDLIFLDIQMPKLNGFEVLELLGEVQPQVIFVTAHDEHALRAFEVHAQDYLLKPFSRERLSESLARVQPMGGPTTAPSPQELAAEAREGAWLERVLVRDGSRIHVLPVERIDYVEAQDDYIALVVGGKKILKQQTLTDLGSRLDPGRFVRVHRSYLLNLDCLARLELYAKDSRVAILRDGSRLPVSRSGYGRLKTRL
jgi:two-component system LytT family response regulator